MAGLLGVAQTEKSAAKAPVEVWYQNAALIYVPFVLVGALLAWTMLKSVPMKVDVRRQFDIFANRDTWYMTLLYIMTFGTFAGLSGQFDLLIKNLYGAGNPEIAHAVAGAAPQILVAGYAVPGGRS